MANFSNLNGSDVGEGLSDEEFLKEIIFPPVYIWVLVLGLNSLVFVLGLFANGVVAWSVVRNQENWTGTNILLSNLAISNFLVIFLCLPPTIAYDITETWFLGNTWCKTVSYIQLVSFCVSIFTLTWISGERWYAICLPIKCLRTKHWAKRRAIIAIASIWVISLIIAVPNLIFLETRPHPYVPEKLIYMTQCRLSWDDDSLDSIVTFFYLKFGILYALPLFVMALAYCHMFCKLWSRFNFISTNSSSNEMHQQRLSRDKAKMLGIVVMTFAVLHFPVYLVHILSYAIQMSRNGLKAAALISHFLCYLNSVISPAICYKVMNEQFRMEFRRSIACFIRCRWLVACFSSWSGRSVRGESIPLTHVVSILPSLDADTACSSSPAPYENLSIEQLPAAS